eukprot:TRINITY_DN15667_c0_g1_i1.p1 TRINITY_DN15667_c0_g1~~TRINITY_DN15667_c0_g1_i1.p1  ORF type:complete len:240 (+),score=28.62 TRINITY_DN15667_c0_g1_i1:62-781(+)
MSFAKGDAQPKIPVIGNVNRDEHIADVECTREAFVKGLAMVMCLCYLFYNTLMDTSVTSQALENIEIGPITLPSWGNVSNDYCLEAGILAIPPQGGHDACLPQLSCFGNCDIRDRIRHSSLVTSITVTAEGEVLITSKVGLTSFISISLDEDPLPDLPIDFNIHKHSCKALIGLKLHPPSFTTVVTKCKVVHRAVFQRGELPSLIKVSVFNFQLSADRYPKPPSVVTSNFYISIPSRYG